jgi:hypothetical protein
VIQVVLAAVVAGGATNTLAGVALGSSLAKVLAEYPSVKPSVNSKRYFAWTRPGGGTVAVTTDDDGTITRIAFVADKRQSGNIDLPCVAAFPVQDSHVNLELALEKTPCSAFNGLTYGVPDRSVVEVRFDGPGDGQLAEATWYRPSQKNRSPVGHAVAVIDYLRPVLASTGRGARVYYAATCSAEEDNFGQARLIFPAVNLQPASQGVTGIAAAQQIFRDDPNIKVAQDRSGTLRVTIGSTSIAILRTRISALTLDSSAQYTPRSAVILAIPNAPAVLAAERRLKVERIQGVIDIIAGGPSAGAPHLSKIMSDVTMDEALDYVARTFNGIVLYGVCTHANGKNLFDLGFASGS